MRLRREWSKSRGNRYAKKSYTRAGYGSEDGNKMDNFGMLWNIDKIFGML